jgi:predicted nucleotidyltransferase
MPYTPKSAMQNHAMNSAGILQMLHARIPNLLAVYAFGSRIQGSAGPDSDLDLAVLVAGYADPLQALSLNIE